MERPLVKKKKNHRNNGYSVEKTDLTFRTTISTERNLLNLWSTNMKDAPFIPWYFPCNTSILTGFKRSSCKTRDYGVVGDTWSGDKGVGKN